MSTPGELLIEESFRMSFCVHSLSKRVKRFGSKISKPDIHSRGSRKRATQRSVGSRRRQAVTLMLGSRLARFGLSTLTLVIGAKESDAPFVMPLSRSCGDGDSRR